MKKALSLILAIAMSLSLCACGKNPAVQNVETLIKNIGTVTIDSGDAISAARIAYDALGKEDKSNVSNLDKLTEAEAIYQKIAPVELTAENISDYLVVNFDFEYAGLDSLGILANHRITCSTYSARNGSFDNVTATIRITLEPDWYVLGTDTGRVEDEEGILQYSFRLPSDGKYSEIHDIFGWYGIADPRPQNITYTFTEVSGTFIPN
ncbi:MAG: hypothetical protein E7437_03785 [Ruminococcaceae bacterium]|nr:hypothetical protein [Oscillospiraceae bacterium]